MNIKNNFSCFCKYILFHTVYWQTMLLDFPFSFFNIKQICTHSFRCVDAELEMGIGLGIGGRDRMLYW